MGKYLYKPYIPYSAVLIDLYVRDLLPKGSKLKIKRIVASKGKRQENPDGDQLPKGSKIKIKRDRKILTENKRELSEPFHFQLALASAKVKMLLTAPDQAQDLSNYLLIFIN